MERMMTFLCADSGRLTNRDRHQKSARNLRRLRLLAAVAATPLVSLLTPQGASAATAYWDSNGASPGGSAGTTATGNWTSSNFWSADPDGNAVTAGWTAGDVAIFSAGTNVTDSSTITLSSPQTAGGLTIEEGTII